MKDHQHQNRTESCTAMSRRPPHQNSSLETHAAAASKRLFGCLLCRKSIQSVPWEQVAFICIMEEPKMPVRSEKQRQTVLPFPFLVKKLFYLFKQDWIWKRPLHWSLSRSLSRSGAILGQGRWGCFHEHMQWNFTSVLAIFHFQSWVIGMLCLTFYPWFYLYRTCSTLVSSFFFSIWSTCCQQNLQNSISPDGMKLFGAAFVE